VKTARCRSTRFPAVPNRVRLEWWVGLEAREATARLLDISPDGASVVTEGRQPPHGRVWLRLEDPSATGWVSADVVGLPTGNRADLTFPRDCPHELILGATLGVGFGNLV
jgi:hypothetical protein